MFAVLDGAAGAGAGLTGAGPGPHARKKAEEARERAMVRMAHDTRGALVFASDSFEAGSNVAPLDRAVGLTRRRAGSRRAATLRWVEPHWVEPPAMRDDDGYSSAVAKS